MAAELKIFYSYAKQSMKRLPLVCLAFPKVLSDVYLYFNARFVPAAGCKTHKIWTTLTDFRSTTAPGMKCKTAKVSLSLNSKAVIYE